MTNRVSSIDIISILAQAEGKFVSGEYLSQCLGISRTAVWKRIGTLKKEGYNIEASTKKGYRLSLSEIPYGKTSIEQGLSTQTFGKDIKYFREVDSTNNCLKRLAAEGAPEGTVVIADCQTAGRGRMGRNWMSAPQKGVWMSLLLRPQLHPSQVQVLTLAASVAVCKALEPLDIQGLGIKWPNDILIGRKKTCDILTEISAEAERVAWVVVGIGLNVNHLSHDFSPEISETATSLRLEKDPDKLINRSIVAANIINSFEEVYRTYLEQGTKFVIEEWKKYNLTLGNKIRLSSYDGESIMGTAYEILPDGRLSVKKDDGTLLNVLSGEVSLRQI